MDKKGIKGSEILYDILVGLPNRDLMEKYDLSPTGLQTVLKRLLKSGSLKQSEVDARLQSLERSGTAPSSCPKCGTYQSGVDERCASCGHVFAESVKSESEQQAEPMPRGGKDGLKDLLEGAILGDIRAGLTDEELMDKYPISRQTILNLLSKFLWEGLLTHEDLEKRRSLAKTVYMPTFTCSACKRIHFEKRDQCPHCGAEMKHGFSDPTKPLRRK
jgi:uncharacterized OB-fold protein